MTLPVTLFVDVLVSVINGVAVVVYVVIVPVDVIAVIVDIIAAVVVANWLLQIST